MNEFKSDVTTSVILRLIRNVGLLFILCLINEIFNYEFSKLDYFVFGVVYCSSFFIQLYITNNDLIICKNDIIIRPSIFSSIGARKYKINDISKVTFKEDWVDRFQHGNGDNKLIVRFVILYFILFLIIPFEYKWIQVETNKKKKFRFYFYGLDYDDYDAPAQENDFEDMFLTLSKKGITVKWKNLEDSYFNSLQETADSNIVRYKSK